MSGRSAALLILKDGSDDRRVTLLAGSLELGRSDDNEICLPDISVSRRHARIFVTDDRVVFEDLGSGNGSWFKGRRIRTQTLVHGDEIMIEPFTLRLEVEEAEAVVELTDHTDDGYTDPGGPGHTEVLADAGMLPVDVAEPDAPRGRLETLSGSRLEDFYDVDPEGLTLGRSDQRDVVLVDPAASRLHCEIVFSAGRYHVRDPGSANGISINDRKVREKVLDDGDTLLIGSTKFRWVQDLPGAPSTVAIEDAPPEHTENFSNVMDDEPGPPPVGFGAPAAGFAAPSPVADGGFGGGPAASEAFGGTGGVAFGAAPGVAEPRPPAPAGFGMPPPSIQPPPSLQPPPALQPPPSLQPPAAQPTYPALPPGPASTPPPSHSPPPFQPAEFGGPPTVGPPVASAPPAYGAPGPAPGGGVGPPAFGTPSQTFGDLSAPADPLAPDLGARPADAGFGGVEMAFGGGGGARPRQAGFLSSPINRISIGLLGLILVMMGFKVVRDLSFGSGAGTVGGGGGGEILVASTPENELLYNRKMEDGWSSFRDGRYFTASTRFAEAMDIIPSRPDARRMAAYSFEFVVIGTLEEVVAGNAASAEEQAKVKADALLEAENALGGRSMKRLKSARSAVQDAVAVVGDDRELAEAEEALDAKIRSLGGAMVQQSKKNHAARIEEMYNRCQGEMQRRNYPQAKSCFREVQAEDSDRATSYYTLAEDGLKRADNEMRKRAQPLYQQGVAFMNQGRSKEARSKFREALRLYPDYTSAQQKLDQTQVLLQQQASEKYKQAKVFESANQIDKAIVYYKEVQSLVGNSKDRLHTMAQERINNLVQ